MQLAQIFIFFLVYSFFGWLWEGLLSIKQEHRFINRGFLNGPYCPIYGCGALAFVWLQRYVNDPIFLFLAGGAIACALEYITSYTMEKLFNARWWDYSDWPFHINGRICLFGFLGFGAGAVAIKFVHPAISNFVATIPNIEIWATILTVLFVIDVISTNNAFARFNKVLKEYQAILKHGRVVSFIERKGHRIIATISKQKRRIFTYQQKRILRAFPNFKTHYDKAFAEVTKFYKATKFKPLKEPLTRKKREKKLK